MPELTPEDIAAIQQLIRESESTEVPSNKPGHFGGMNILAPQFRERRSQDIQDLGGFVTDDQLEAAARAGTTDRREQQNIPFLQKIINMFSGQ